MGYFENLTTQKEPLTSYERDELANWLGLLKRDCKTFGETGEDTRRMTAIRRKLNGGWPA